MRASGSRSAHGFERVGRCGTRSGSSLVEWPLMRYVSASMSVGPSPRARARDGVARHA